MKKEKMTRKNTIFLIFDIIVLVIVLSIAYGAFSYAKPGTKVNKIIAGAITMSYTEGSNKISIVNATPMSDASGEAMNGEGEYFDFTISTNMTTSQPISYEVTAERDNDSTLGNDEVRLYLEKYETDSEVASGEAIEYEEVFSPKAYTPIDSENATGEDEMGAKNTEMLLDTGEITTDKTVYYRLRMWVAEDYTHTQDSNTFEATVNVYGKDVAVEGANGITLSKSSLTMQKGETKQISATITPASAKNKNLIWTSLNPSVAKVDSEGNITAVLTGTARIKVQTSDKSKFAECVVTVVDADAESVSLNTESVTLVRGSTNQLTATVLPVDASDKSVTWSSGSNGIATVSSTGLVTAVGIGVTTITVETVNGKTAECEVTVVAPSVDTITISGANTVDIGTTTQLSIANASGETTGEVSSLDLVWSSSDTTKATVSSNGLVTGIGAGSVTITASVKEYPDIYTTKTITVQKPEIREITMSSDTTINTGNTTIFMIALNPADVRNKADIVWTSSNTSVATIPQECAGQTYCEIEGLTEGSTTITARTTNAIYDTATLTVESAPEIISYIVDVVKTNAILLSSTSSDTNPIYYYNGNASTTNNNIIFGGYCWKIIRTTETGGIKMIYNGTPSNGECSTTTGASTQIGTSRYNDTYNSTAYDSTAKTEVDNWYSSNLYTNYDSYLEPTEYCGDTLDTSNPLSNCTDSYNLKVGLINADEVFLAGLDTTNTNTTNYLYTGEQYWTMSAGTGTSSQSISFSKSGSDYKNGTYTGTGISNNTLTTNTSGIIVNSNNGTYYGTGNISSCMNTYGGNYVSTRCCIDYSDCIACAYRPYASNCYHPNAGGLSSSYDESVSGSSLGLRPVISLRGYFPSSGKGTSTQPYVLFQGL